MSPGLPRLADFYRAGSSPGLVDIPQNNGGTFMRIARRQFATASPAAKIVLPSSRRSIVTSSACRVPMPVHFIPHSALGRAI